MKSSDEMFAHLLERRNDYEAARNQKRRTLMRTVLPVLSLSLMLLAGMIVWYTYFDEPDRAEYLNRSLSEQNRSWNSRNILIIDEQEYYVATERSFSLPEGYVFLRELLEEECTGTGLAGCKLYVPVQSIQDPYWDDFWLYQPEEKLIPLVNGEGESQFSYFSENGLQWSYLHCIHAPIQLESGK